VCRAGGLLTCHDRIGHNHKVPEGSVSGESGKRIYIHLQLAYLIISRLISSVQSDDRRVCVDNLPLPEYTLPIGFSSDKGFVAQHAILRSEVQLSH